MRVLVVTVVHRPDDARIRQRQISALLDAGHTVTYAAPFSAWGVEPSPAENLTLIDTPRSSGIKRMKAVRALPALLGDELNRADVCLVHDPELVPWLLRQRGHPAALVWDIHEDTAAAVSMKSYVPALLRPFVRWYVHRLEARAERYLHLLLAEDAYQERFSSPHPVIPNSTPVPVEVAQPHALRAVYVGRVSKARGGLDLIMVGRELAARGSKVSIEVIGDADTDMVGPLPQAHSEVDLIWHGYLENQTALRIIEGSIAGLSLLHDEENYRHSRPTKIIEYMARGIPVVTTSIPLARQLVEDNHCGVIVPFSDADAVATAVEKLANDLTHAGALAQAGHVAALRDFNWNEDKKDFLSILEQWTRQ